MERLTLDSLLVGMERGGWANHHARDGQPGLGYVAHFDANQLGRSGGIVLNNPSCDGDHYDVIERMSEGSILHHRIYKP